MPKNTSRHPPQGKKSSIWIKDEHKGLVTIILWFEYLSFQFLPWQLLDINSIFNPWQNNTCIVLIMNALKPVELIKD